jgi:hypothetical protein
MAGVCAVQHQSLMSHEEVARLKSILASFPTSEAADLQLLHGERATAKLTGRQSLA